MTTTRLLVATGSRAEFGLLTPVIDALIARSKVEVRLAVMGSHLLQPSRTVREVIQRYAELIAGEVEMQHDGATGRLEDAMALGRGVLGFSSLLADELPDWVLVLGDRIEAFAAASAASVGGVLLAHIHGGDRAEGVADEAMRHAITKLSHLHFAATPTSAKRIMHMGEDEWRVRVVGSPAIDGLDDIPVMDDESFAELGSPSVVVLYHPCGVSAQQELAYANAITEAVSEERVLWMSPNFDAGREIVLHTRNGVRGKKIDHLPRSQFVGLLRKLGDTGGVLVGNSSSGLIEASALKCPVVDVGPRQEGRERPYSVIHVQPPMPASIRVGIKKARELDRWSFTHPYGDGHAGKRIAEAITEVNWSKPTLMRKRNSY